MKVWDAWDGGNAPVKKEQKVLKGLSGEKRIDLKLKVSFDTLKNIWRKTMKKILLVMLLTFLTVSFGMHPGPVPSCTMSHAYLFDWMPGNAHAEEVQGVSVTMPMETGATAFWFPETGTFAAGLSHTFLRVQYTDVDFPTLSRISVDLDGTIAQEVNKDKDTLAGLGIKANFNTTGLTQPGFTFLPSIGLTALNNFEKFHQADDIVDNLEVAVYGTLLQYRW